MSSSTIHRLSGVSLIIGGLLAAIGVIGQAFVTDLFSPIWSLVSAFVYVGLLFILLGIPAVYTRQMKRTGKFGLIGFILFFVACMQFGGSSGVFDIVALPWLTKINALNNPPLSFILFFIIVKLFLFVGSFVFGIAALRTAALPKWSVILLLAGTVLFILGGRIHAIPYLDYLGEILFFLSFAWFGFALLSLLRREEELQPAPTSSGTPVRA